MQVGQALRDYMDRTGWSSDGLGAQIGISGTVIDNLKTNADPNGGYYSYASKPSPKTLRALRKISDLPAHILELLDDLIDWEGRVLRRQFPKAA